MSRMRPRRLAAWLLSFPLMVVGTQVAHAFAYQLAYPSAHVRLNVLLSTGHAYMVGYPGYLPALLGAVGAAELLGVGWVLAGSVRRDLARPVPAWAFALLPMLCFTLQELLERLFLSGRFPWWMVLQPTFRLGLLLQLPFALAAFLLAKLLLRSANRVGASLRGSAPLPRLLGCASRWVLVVVCPPRRRAPASGHAGRGPPRAAAAVIAPAR
jgi:hypothetical protein